jgi:small nuclear ribonucleoprotein (snRNP)-like protein
MVHSYCSSVACSNKVKVLDLVVGQPHEGPLSLLHTWYSQRSSVRVVTRHSRGVRGVAIGTLVAFDKHTNLVLKDVEEQYTVLLPVLKDGGRRGRRQERRQRRLKQVLICGSSVVLVSRFTTTRETVHA